MMLSLVEVWAETVIEEAHYQSLLAGQKNIVIQNTDTMYIPNRFMCIFIAKTTKQYSSYIF